MRSGRWLCRCLQRHPLAPETAGSRREQGELLLSMHQLCCCLLPAGMMQAAVWLVSVMAYAPDRATEAPPACCWLREMLGKTTTNNCTHALAKRLLQLFSELKVPTASGGCMECWHTHLDGVACAAARTCSQSGYVADAWRSCTEDNVHERRTAQGDNEHQQPGRREAASVRTQHLTRADTQDGRDIGLHLRHRGARHHIRLQPGQPCRSKSNWYTAAVTGHAEMPQEPSTAACAYLRRHR